MASYLTMHAMQAKERNGSNKNRSSATMLSFTASFLSVWQAQKLEPSVKGQAQAKKVKLQAGKGEAPLSKKVILTFRVI